MEELLKISKIVYSDFGMSNELLNGQSFLKIISLKCITSFS